MKTEKRYKVTSPATGKSWECESLLSAMNYIDRMFERKEIGLSTREQLIKELAK